MGAMAICKSDSNCYDRNKYEYQRYKFRSNVYIF